MAKRKTKQTPRAPRPRKASKVDKGTLEILRENYSARKLAIAELGVAEAAWVKSMTLAMAATGRDVDRDAVCLQCGVVFKADAKHTHKDTDVV